MKGIVRDRYGFRAYVKVGNIQREKRYPPDTPAKTMQDWRDETRVSLRGLTQHGAAPAGSLSEAIARYLRLVAAMPTIVQRTAHLQQWADAIGGHVQRHAITPAHIRAVLQDWRRTLSAATCNKRRTALMHLWSVLDGKGARNPVRDVPKFRAEDPLPRGRDPHVIDVQLRAAAACRSRACCRVLLWTGMRPAELQRAEPSDLELRQAFVIVRTAKGGRSRVVPLTRQGVQAWREFVRWDCWGNVPQAAPLNRWLKDRTGMDDLRVYDLRHSYGTALARRETRLDVIGALMGHSTLELTKRYTLAAVQRSALDATGKLGRKHTPRTASRTASIRRRNGADRVVSGRSEETKTA